MTNPLLIFGNDGPAQNDSSPAGSLYINRSNILPTEPIGTWKGWHQPAGTAVPEDWLECNGAAFNPTLYPDFVIYLKSLGLDTDVTPDWRGRFPRCAGTDTPNIGKTQEDAIRNITGETPPIVASFADNSGTNGALLFQKNGWYPTNNGSTQNYGNPYAEISIDFAASRTVPTDNENRPKSFITNFIIKAK